VKQNLEKEALLTAEIAHQRLAYDPETGLITHRDWSHLQPRPGTAAMIRRRAGTPAGRKNHPDGYLRLSLYLAGKECMFLAHRVAHFMMTGEWPQEQVDHINGDRSDNRWTNLRPATNAENCRNKRTNGETVGVRWEEKRQYWRAYIRVDSRQITKCFNPRHFSSSDDARQAAINWQAAMAFEHHGVRP